MASLSALLLLLFFEMHYVSIIGLEGDTEGHLVECCPVGKLCLTPGRYLVRVCVTEMGVPLPQCCLHPESTLRGSLVWSMRPQRMLAAGVPGSSGPHTHQEAEEWSSWGTAFLALAGLGLQDASSLPCPCVSILPACPGRLETPGFSGKASVSSEDRFFSSLVSCASLFVVFHSAALNVKYWK